MRVSKKALKIRTVGVRFIYGNGFQNKIYTYAIRKAAKVHLGQQLVVENQFGTQVVVVVRIDKDALPHTATITQRVADL